MLITKLKTGAGLCLAVGLALLLGTGWGYGTFAADKPQAEKQVDTLRDTLLVLDKQFWEAGGKHDVDTLSKLIAHDYVGIAADGTKFTKDATLQNYRTMRTAELKLTTEREVVRINDSAAVMTYQGKYKVFNKAGELIATLHQSMTSCWVQRDGGWFVVFSRASDLPTPAPAALLHRELQVDPNNLWRMNTLLNQNTLVPILRFSPLTGTSLNATQFSTLLQDPAKIDASLFRSPSINPYALAPVRLLDVANQPVIELPKFVEKVLKAHGGADKLNAVTTFSERVIIRTEDVATANHFVQLPNKYRVETKTGPAGKTQTHTFILNGGERWHLLNGVRVELLGLERPSEYWEEYLKYYGPRAVLRLKDPANELHLMGESKVGERVVVGIRITPKTGPERRMYFDKETALLLKEECAAQELEIVYKDYKTLGGFPIAQKRVAKIAGHESESLNRPRGQPGFVADNVVAKLFDKP